MKGYKSVGLQEQKLPPTSKSKKKHKNFWDSKMQSEISKKETLQNISKFQKSNSGIDDKKEYLHRTGTCPD